MKYNTLRRKFRYNPITGRITDLKMTQKTGIHHLLGDPQKLKIRKSVQFPHLGYRPHFWDLDQNHRRKRHKELIWIPDLIHWLYHRKAPTGPLVYLSDKWYEYHEYTSELEQKLYDATGSPQYETLRDLEPYTYGGFSELHFKIRYLTWFRPIHPFIYWNWRRSSWTLGISIDGRRISKYYPFDQYVDAASQVVHLLAKRRGVPRDRYRSDPLLDRLLTATMPLLPRSQSARATAMGVRRPETRIEALWRYVTDQHIRRTYELGDTPDFDPEEFYGVELMAQAERALGPHTPPPNL